MIGQVGREERDRRQAGRDEPGVLGDVLENVDAHGIEEGAAGDLRLQRGAVALVESDHLRILAEEHSLPGEDAIVIAGRGVGHGEGEDAAERCAAGDDARPGMEDLNLQTDERDVVHHGLDVPRRHGGAIENAALAGAGRNALETWRVAVDVEVPQGEVLGDRGARGAARVALLVESEGEAERRQEQDGAPEMGSGDVPRQADHFEPVERMGADLHGQLGADEVAVTALGGAHDRVGPGGHGRSGRQQDGEGHQQQDASDLHGFSFLEMVGQHCELEKLLNQGAGARKVRDSENSDATASDAGSPCRESTFSPSRSPHSPVKMTAMRLRRSSTKSCGAG
jgi:hypothetical protein